MEKTLHSQDYAVFLTALRSARTEAGLTQLIVARRLQETQTFVSKCERGERRIDIVELQKWCAALGSDLIEFVKRFEALQKKSRKDVSTI
jgi:transcriptional regulator with XRE-family HTH domain